MAVVLIFRNEPNAEGPETPLAGRIDTVVLPSRKVINKKQNDDLVEYIADYEVRWKEDSQLRYALASESKDFYLENFDDGEMSPPDSNAKEMPLSAFYWMILRHFDSQSTGSAIFTDEDAKELLREGGWFNA